MFQNMTHVTFFCRNKKDKANTYALYCRLVLNGKPSEFSTGETIDPSEWNQEAQLYIGSTEEKTDYINLLTERIKYKLKTLVLLAKKNNTTLHPKDIIEAYRNPEKLPEIEKGIVIFEVIEKYIAWEISEGELDEKTIAIHQRYLKHIKQFANRKQYFVTDFTEVEAERFKEWFKAPRKTGKRDIPGTKNKTTASRHVSYYRNALNWGVKTGIIKSHNLLFYEGERDKTKKPIPLNQSELLAIIQHTFKNKMLIRIRDLFLFQIVTGISYGDVWSDFTIQDTPAGKIIVGRRNKGIGNSFYIPYDEMAEAILVKYNFVLPKYCNGTYNRLLKEIAALVGIDKILKTHTGRKTFASLKFSQGWTLSAVSIMLGHSSEKTTETYYVEKNSGFLISEMLQRSQQQQQQQFR